MPHTIGDILFDIVLPGADRARLAAFSKGTEDPNPIHVDEEFARAAGFSTVLQQGPMTTAHFARLLAEKVGQANLKWLDVTFMAPVYPDQALKLTAVVNGAEERGRVVTCALTATNPDGVLTAKAEAGFRV